MTNVSDTNHHQHGHALHPDRHAKAQRPETVLRAATASVAPNGLHDLE